MMDTETSPGRMEVEGEADGDGEKRSLRDFSAMQVAADGDESREHARPRKRTRRACDKCSSSRTRCDGEYPW